jgi:hypothetical protein
MMKRPFFLNSARRGRFDGSQERVQFLPLWSAGSESSEGRLMDLSQVHREAFARTKRPPATIV